MKGAVPPAIRTIASHAFFTDKCSFPTNRGQDKNVAAKLLLLSHSNQFVNTKKTDLDSFVKRFEQSASQPADLQAAIDRTLSILGDLAPEFADSDPKLKASGLIPVYFRVVEEHGSGQFGPFLTFWNVYASVEDGPLGEADWIDDALKSRVRLFNVLKRNVNDSTAMQRMFVMLSMEFRRYRSGGHVEAIRGIPRIKARDHAAKQLAKAMRAERLRRRT